MLTKQIYVRDGTAIKAMTDVMTMNLIKVIVVASTVM